VKSRRSDSATAADHNQGKIRDDGYSCNRIVVDGCGGQRYSAGQAMADALSPQICLWAACECRLTKGGAVKGGCNSNEFQIQRRSQMKNQILAAMIILACSLASAQSLSKGKGDLRVMTYNANEGTDLLEVQAAKTSTDFLIAVGATITQVRETNPPARMQALAKQIIAASPTLVGLQELDQWSTGPLDLATFQCGATTLEFDMLQELQDALTAHGAHYKIAVQAQQYAFAPTPGLILSSGTYLCVQLTNNIAVLARTDLAPSQFSSSNPNSAPYSATLSFPTPVGIVQLPRAWASVDATSHGQPLRFITTHLESVDTTLFGLPSIREAQGAELRSGPANTSMPVVVAMDSNSQAAPLPQDATYVDFTLAGYNDVWSQLHPGIAGLTCCQSELDNNPVSQLYQRIDLILTLGPIESQNITLFGATPASKTTDGLWPSDHAGVAAQLVLESN
jgi:endonuclease/exonuclease/phosphatase family metal-dependent hydrolase